MHADEILITRAPDRDREPQLLDRGFGEALVEPEALQVETVVGRLDFLGLELPDLEVLLGRGLLNLDGSG
jgi:hypothetical protein